MKPVVSEHKELQFHDSPWPALGPGLTECAGAGAAGAESSLVALGRERKLDYESSHLLRVYIPSLRVTLTGANSFHAAEVHGVALGMNLAS